MNWLIKAAAFKMLSSVPGGPALYSYCREHLTGALVPTPERVGQKIDVGMRYWEWFAAHHFSGRLQGESHLDFGTGWHPTIPLLFYSLGIERQALLDVAPFLNGQLMESTVKMFRQIVTSAEWGNRAQFIRMPEPIGNDGTSLATSLGKLGIEYHAPYEGTLPDLAGSIGFATCTQVLYFIPEPALRNCFHQVWNCLKKGGKFLATVHLNDVNATWDKRISQYNHLRYSSEVWDHWVNSRLMAYNRLKAADYRQLLEETGFEIRHFDVTGPTAADLEELSHIPVHRCFNRYSREELGAKHLYFVAEKI